MICTYVRAFGIPHALIHIFSFSLLQKLIYMGFVRTETEIYYVVFYKYGSN